MGETMRWLLLILSLQFVCHAQLGPDCVVSMLNRTATVLPDGGYVIPNVPADQGFARIRATCVRNGQTLAGQSGFLRIFENSRTTPPAFPLGVVQPPPVSLAVNTPSTTLTTRGATTQLNVLGTFPDASVRDLTAASTGTTYTVSNSALATVSPDGLITAVASGGVIISVVNDGTLAIASLKILLSGDTDNDGIPDDIEITNGLDPNNPADALGDLDNDGLANAEEYARGTGVANPDTDGDGLTDGDEVFRYSSNPLKVDTDGDLLPDGFEARIAGNATSVLPTGDADGDALSNLDEFNAKTDPLKPDTDGDRALDGLELASGCNPLVAELTTFTGRVVDQAQAPRIGAFVTVSGQSATTDSNGRFVVTRVSACPAKSVRVSARWSSPGSEYSGQSGLFSTITGAVDVGDISVKLLSGPLYPGSVLFSTGSSPRQVLLADINRDGRPDAVVNNSSTQQGLPWWISFYLRNADGTFQAESRVNLTFSPSYLRAADLNGDGFVDLVTLSSYAPHGGAVLLNKGDNTFRVTPMAAFGTLFDLGDTNGDGKPDLIDIRLEGTNYYDYKTIARVRIGAGDGTFGPAIDTQLSVGGISTEAIVRDFNGDSIPDVMTARDTGFSWTVSLYLGNRQGSFDSGRFFSVPGASSLEAADFDRDGRLDFVAVGYTIGSRITLVTLDANLAVKKVSSYPLVEFANPSIAVGDLNGDSILDVVTSGTATYPFLGNGDGTLRPGPRYAHGSYNSSSGGGKISLLDVTSDGSPDLLIPTGGNYVAVLESNGDGSLFGGLLLNVVGTRVTTSADFNADGIKDVVAANGALVQLVNNGDGNTTPFSVPDPNGAGSYAMATGEINGDGYIDLVVGYYGSSLITVWTSKPAGGFTSVQTLSSNWESIRVGDLNGDGKADIVARLRGENTITIYINDGTGRFGAGATIPVPQATLWIELARINSDTRDDLIIGGFSFDTYTGQVLTYLTNPDGSLGPAKFTQLPVMYSGWRFVAATDANRDTKTDLVLDASLGAVYLLSGNGDGTFNSPAQIATENENFSGVGEWSWADLNGDGWPDLLGLRYAGDIVVYFASQNGVYQPPQRFYIGSDRELSLGNFFGRGLPDLAVGLSLIPHR